MFLLTSQIKRGFQLKKKKNYKRDSGHLQELSFIIWVSYYPAHTKVTHKKNADKLYIYKKLRGVSIKKLIFWAILHSQVKHDETKMWIKNLNPHYFF